MKKKNKVFPLLRMHFPPACLPPRLLSIFASLLQYNLHAIKPKHFKCTQMSFVKHTHKGVTASSTKNKENDCHPKKVPLPSHPHKQPPLGLLPQTPRLCFLSPQMSLLELDRNKHTTCSFRVWLFWLGMFLGFIPAAVRVTGLFLFVPERLPIEEIQYNVCMNSRWTCGLVPDSGY